MFQIEEDLSISATRGDIVFFSVSMKDSETKEAVSFQPGDKVSFKLYGKKDAETVLLQKDFPVTEEAETVDIFLSREDMKVGDVISKPKDYWYEVVLNDDSYPQTIIGYDADGPKLFRLYPEGADIPPWEPEPEELPAIDEELDLTSKRPVQNQAIARKLAQMTGQIEKLRQALEKAGITVE